MKVSVRPCKFAMSKHPQVGTADRVNGSDTRLSPNLPGKSPIRGEVRCHGGIGQGMFAAYFFFPLAGFLAAGFALADFFAAALTGAVFFAAAFAGGAAAAAFLALPLLKMAS